MPDEKRQYIRTPAAVSLFIQYKQGSDIKQIEAATKNISATGMMIEAGEKLPIGQDMDIAIRTPEASGPIHCKGKTIWAIPLPSAGKYNCGIEFTHIEEDNKNTFLKFLCDAIYGLSNNE